MASTTGPLMSMDASGTVGGAIVFSKWKGRNYVRRHAVPSNPKAQKQRGVRAMMSFLSGLWPSIKATVEVNWEPIASGAKHTALNAYVRENFTRYKTGRGITEDYPAAEISTPASAPTLTATGAAGYASVVITKGSDAPDLAWAVHVYSVTGEGCGLPNLRLVVPYTASPITVIIPELDAGTWYIKVSGWNDDGILGTASAEATCVTT